jgi:hypothetical protein
MTTADSIYLFLMIFVLVATVNSIADKIKARTQQRRLDIDGTPTDAADTKPPDA